MAKFIEAQGLTEAWLKAAEHILEQPGQECVHMFLSIAAPTAINAPDKDAIAVVDEFLTRNGQQPIDTVADTIFPKSHYLKNGVDGVMDDYPATMQRFYDEDAHLRKHWPWGTYAFRMLRYPGKEGANVNQLKTAMHKLATTDKKSCFEISTGVSLADPSLPANAAEIATYSPADDARLNMGGPCLSHLSFTRDNAGGRLHLNATYRSHYYMQRALGNLVGLSGLLAFVAHETGHDCGSLAINSTFAKLDTKGFGGKTGVRNLLKEVRMLYGGNDAK